MRAVPLSDRCGLRLIGEVDLSTWAVLEAELTPVLESGEDVHLELTELRFIDARGATILAMAAQRLDGARRLVLHNPPVVLTRLLDVLWPDAPIETARS